MNDFNSTVASTSGVGVRDEGLRQYMIGVYNYMALGIGVSGLVAMLIAGNQQVLFALNSNPILHYAPFVLILGLGFIGGKIIYSGSKLTAHAIYWAYAISWGLLVAPFIYTFQASGDAAMIYRAFFITAAVFGGTSLYGYTTKKSLSGWGSFLFMATLGLLVAIIVNALIFKSDMMSLIVSCLVVLVFSAVTAYETQMVKSLYSDNPSMNERSSIFGAFMLFGSFATLFIHILNILGFMRD